MYGRRYILFFLPPVLPNIILFISCLHSKLLSKTTNEIQPSDLQRRKSIRRTFLERLAPPVSKVERRCSTPTRRTTVVLLYVHRSVSALSNRIKKPTFVVPKNLLFIYYVHTYQVLDWWQWKAESLKFPKIPAKLCLNGRLWTQSGAIVFWNSPKFRKKTISRGDLGHHRPENFSSRSWIRRGAISCSHTSFDKINDSVVNTEHGELDRGSDPPFG